jgi:phage I-like protein
MKPFTEIRIAKWATYTQPQWIHPLIVRRVDGPAIVRASKQVLIDLEFSAGHATELRDFFDSALGLCRIAARTDGLYAVAIEWKEEAIALLEVDAYEFLVPAFQIDKSGIARRVIGLALTNSAIAGWESMVELLSLGAALPSGKHARARSDQARTGKLSSSRRR